MSNMSELSIATRSAGPHHMDELAHELARTAVSYADGDIGYQDFREAVDKFRDASWVVEEASSRDLRLSELLGALANEYAFMESLTEGRDYTACHAKLLEWQRARRGMRALGYTVYAPGAT